MKLFGRIFCGLWLMFYQIINKLFSSYRIFGKYIPAQFYQKPDGNIPAYIGIDGLCIGASGYILHKCDPSGFHATQLYVNKFGLICKKQIIS